MSFWLECTACGSRSLSRSTASSCASCGAELVTRYAPGSHIAARGPGIFRFGGRLPVRDPERAVSLGEGDTPLIDLGGPVATRLGVSRVRVKCESMNPTGSFKDRIAALAATIMVERAIPACVGTSSGNGGAAMAAYAARSGRRVVIFALADTVPQKLLQIRALGGRVVALRGLGHDAAATEAAAVRIVHHAESNDLLPFVTARRFAPEAMEGAKTIAYELAEQAPEATAVYVPVGGGGLFSALWRGYEDARDALPCARARLVAVQPRGCPTIREMFGRDPAGAAARSGVTTTISGLQVAVLFDAIGVADALEGSRGHFVEVDDHAVWAAQRELAEGEGLLVEPAGATALAGAFADAALGRLAEDDDLIVVATGAGYKDAASLARIAGDDPIETCETGDIAEVLARLATTTDA